ncbi:MAG TPA: hypothetical protein VFW30_05245 [Bryocella sp.]|nr:hypothetical protein [Bryocella sp.]
MSSGGWTTSQSTEVAAGGDHRQQPAYMLRPLSLGEILDRSFAVYRANFWLFVGIGSLSAVVRLVLNAIQVVIFHGIVPTPQQVQAQFHQQAVARQVGVGITALVFLLASAVTQAAAVWALSEVYLGRRATIGQSIRSVAGRTLRFVGIALWQLWSAAWVLVLVAGVGTLLLFGLGVMRSPWIGGTLMFLGIAGGGVYGVFAFIRNSLGVQSAVLEQLKIRAAMRRSKVLAAGAKGRIFVVYLITWCLFLVAGILEMPLSLLLVYGAMRGEKHIAVQVVMLLVNFIAYSAVVPVMMIGLTLVYFDQRVRQDGLDLLLMLDGGVQAETGGSASPTLQTGEPASDAAAL